MSSFVSPQKTQVHRTAPTMHMEPILRPQRNVELVLATCLENFFFALGSFGIVIAIGLFGHVSEWWMWGDIWRTIILIAFSMFLFVFGFWSVRFGLDDIREMRLRMALEIQCAEYMEEVEQTRNELIFLKRQNHSLTTQHAVLIQQKTIPEQPKPNNELISAKRGAKTLIDRWTNKLPYSRDNSSLTQPEWNAAKELLVRSGVMADKKGKVGYIIIAESEFHALEALNKQVKLEAQAASKNIVVG